MPAGDRRRRRRRKIVGAAGAAVMLATAVLTTTVNYWPGAQSSLSGAAKFVRLWLDADRDIGALPARDAWCSGADHCWVMQQTSGDATDYGDVGGWHLTPQGSPRAGVRTSLPVRDASGWVDYTSELATWGADGNTDGLTEATATMTATAVVSVTVLMHAQPNSTGPYSAVVSHRLTSGTYAGWQLRVQNTTGVMEAIVDGGTPSAAMYTTGSMFGAWRCVTAVLDARTATAGHIYVDSAEDTSGGDLSASPGFGGFAAPFRVHGWDDSPGYKSASGVARVAVFDGEARTYAQHLATCGDLWQPPAGGPADNKPLATDDTWTQTGGATCWPASDSSAVCVPGGLTPYTHDGTGLAWPTEPSATNYIPYSTAIDCVTWSCTGTADASTTTVAPDGSYTAAQLTVAGAWAHAVYKSTQTAAYTNNAPLTARVWIKCSAGTADIRCVSTALGYWTVNCATIGGAWTLINAGHAAVTVINPFTASASGAGAMAFADGGGSSPYSVWAPTLTEEPGTGLSVIPTGAAAVSTGDIGWAIDNTLPRYYHTGDTVTQSLTTHSGTCWVVSGTDLLLSGAAGSECAGTWYGLQVTR